MKYKIINSECSSEIETELNLLSKEIDFEIIHSVVVEKRIILILKSG
jgi:hypothetical protein